MPLLFCQVWGGSDAEPFPVKIDGGDTVGELKKLIRAENPNDFKHIDPVHLKLWKWNKSSDEVKDSDLDNCKALDPKKTISDVFKDDIPVQGRTHIIIKTPEPVTGAGVDTLVTEKNTQLPSDDAVVLFWRTLFLKHPNYPVINSEWIHLNPKVNWMGSDTYEQSVFIRPIYNKFWEMINGSSRLWILTGTPGIGKTFFTFFMFVKIRMTQPNAIIARMYRGKTLIFYPDGTVYCSSGEVPRKVSENAENWVIADTVLPGDEGMYCRTVLVTSPKMAGYGRHRKQGFQEGCMPVWDLEELGKVYTQVYKASGLTWEDVESSFELWGGIPRTTLRFINDDA
ncbi:hypothetical protein L211DRAFT_843063 [Terfezia boudieri ATCC MYA-4762]|uniref:Crinkler effector protein N-terminal domain-containing protein n=1 Tax=Terfezia boudieri ATCC MYA-4762 TaxID=1051890 RepID=A0A3N4LBE1_9PEZI|nr:hypothetical protein L211DRAFT_843063 [Terfezia boudieri ATCC MYA-4762]